MRYVMDYFRDLRSGTAAGWNRFWFTPQDPATLGLIRVLAGAMIFYTHLVWTIDLNAFFGQHAWLNAAAVAAVQAEGYHWSHWWWMTSTWSLWTSHFLSLAVCFALMLGWKTRLTSLLTYLVTVSYAQRVPEALYGLDQVNGYLALYLAVGPSGDAYSLDRWLSSRRQALPVRPSISANLAIRLMQVHLCIIYLFAGISKLQGESWWDGTAFWGAVANLEYQTVDLTWLAHSPWLVNFLTHSTIVWEVAYIALIWPRLTRPIMLALAIPVHLGIGFCMGMPTFGTAMLIGNVAFVSPILVRALLDRRQNSKPAKENQESVIPAPHRQRSRERLSSR